MTHKDAAPLYDLSAQLSALSARLPAHRLRPGEARVLGGQLFALGPIFVEAVARALAHGRDLFADLPVTDEDLLGPQARALALRQLAGQLTALAEQAQAGYLIEQAAALRGAFAVVRDVEAEARKGRTSRLSPGAHLLRFGALYHARSLLSQRQREKLGTRAQRGDAPPPRMGTARPSLLDALRRRVSLSTGIE